MKKRYHFMATKGDVLVCDKSGRKVGKDQPVVMIVDSQGLVNYYLSPHQPNLVDLAENALERHVLSIVNYFYHLGEPDPLDSDVVLVWWKLATDLCETNEPDLVAWGILINTAATFLNVGDFDPIEAYTWSSRILQEVPERFKVNRGS